MLLPTISSQKATPALTIIASTLPPLAICVLLIGLCLAHSSETPLWTDEIFSFYPLTDPSLSHMLAVCRDTLNTAPPFYFLSGWFLVKVFGADATTLRLFSSVAFAAAVLVLWSTLRPRYGIVSTAIGLSAALLTHTVLEQNEQARFYGLYFLFVAIALERFTRVFGTSNRSKFIVLVENLVIHLLLLFTHTFGLLYGACLVFTAIILGRRSPYTVPYCVGVVSAWVLFAAAWGTVSVNHQVAFRGYIWIPKPSPTTIQETLFADPHLVFCVTGVIVLCSVRAVWDRLHRDATVPIVPCDPLVFAGAIIVLFPTAATYLASQFITPCFLDRYLLPHALGSAALIAGGVDYATRQGTIPESIQRAVRWLGGGVVVLVIVIPYFTAAWRDLSKASPRPLVTPTVRFDNLLRESGAPEGTPVIHTDPHTFVGTCFYDPQRPSRHIYVVDDEDALRSAILGDGREYSSNRNMVALGRGYMPGSVITVSELVRTRPRFIVIDRRNRWVSRRFAANKGAYKIRRLSPPQSRMPQIYLVERREPTKRNDDRNDSIRDPDPG